MRSKVKRYKLWVCALIAALILPISISNHEVYAAEGCLENEITPSVIVYNCKDLVQAVNNAEDGDVIGIASNICIESGVGVLGSDDKRITIIKMTEGAFIQMYLSADVKIKNITFDGNSSVYNRDYNPMIHVEGKAVFENAIFQNCYNQWAGGAIVVESGEVNLTGCYFANNQAGEGGHIAARSSAHVKATGSIFESGVSARGGGVVKIESSYGNDTKIEFIGCKMIGNQARYGGAIANKGSVKITNSIIYGNTAETGADFLNYSGSSFEMDSIDKLAELYAKDGIRPLEWENDYIDKAYIEGDIDKDNPLSAMKLIYKGILQGNDSEIDNSENNTGNIDKTPNDDNSQNG